MVMPDPATRARPGRRPGSAEWQCAAGAGCAPRTDDTQGANWVHLHRARRRLEAGGGVSHTLPSDSVTGLSWCGAEDSRGTCAGPGAVRGQAGCGNRDWACVAKAVLRRLWSFVQPARRKRGVPCGGDQSPQAARRSDGEPSSLVRNLPRRVRGCE